MNNFKKSFLNVKKNALSLLSEDLFNDLKLFLFILFTLIFYRALFLLYFKSLLLPDTTFYEIAKTLWTGARLSLKSSLALTLPSFLFCTLIHQLKNNWPGAKIRLYFGGFIVVALSLLFQARIPFYIEFGQTFNFFIFNAVNDDIGALVKTAFIQYSAHWRILAAALLSAVLVYLLNKFLKFKPFNFETLDTLNPKIKAFFLAALAGGLILLCFFCSNAGTFCQRKKLSLTNFANQRQNILNQSLLDDPLSLTKALRDYRLEQEVALFTNAIELTPQKVKTSIEYITGKPYNHNSLEPFLEKTAKGARIEKPQHIFLIIAENYAIWPLLEDYSSLEIAQGLKGISASENAVMYTNFLPAFWSTISALRTILSGVHDVKSRNDNTYILTKAPVSLTKAMGDLGYKTVFFYGGFSSWENIWDLTQKYGFDEANFKGHFKGAPSTLWGMEDKYFLQGVEEKITDKPSFNVILTLSNHAPFNVDLKADQQIPPAEFFQKKLPARLQKDKQFIKKLQHFYYADKYLADFISAMKQKYPSSLFIITGDHGERYHPDPNPSAWESTSVPLILYGSGINKNLINPATPGGHINIMPTIIELIAPAGFKYKAFGGDLLSPNKMGIHQSKFITDTFIFDRLKREALPLPGGREPSREELKEAVKYENDVRVIFSWIEKNGLDLNETAH